MASHQPQRLGTPLAALAAVMRRMPTGVRRVRTWWMQLYESIGGGGYDEDPAIDARWPSGVQPPVRVGRAGHRVYLDLRDWAERRAYFSGQFFQNELEPLYAALLRPGDQYLDVGANIGLTALMAAPLIGPGGRGYCFEPNPEVFDRLRRHLDLNGVTQIEPVPVAIGDRESTARLVISGEHSGRGSLVAQDGPASHAFEIRTVTGQPYLDRLDPTRPTLVKIDVEGFELKVLAGLRPLLDWPEVAAVIEVNDDFLRRDGGSADRLFVTMARHGFQAFAFDLARGRLGTRLALSPLDGHDDRGPGHWYDALFARPESRMFHDRIAPLIPSGAR